MWVATQGLPRDEAGRAGRDLLNGKQVAAKARITLQPGDTLTFETPGGGGYGLPWQRPPAQVLADLKNGLISRLAAREEYGVVIADDSLHIDAAATAALRQQLNLGASA